jgi:triosephosphate isomerase (TIM)
MRKKIIAGNWKMHKTIAEAIAFLHGVQEPIRDRSDIDIWIAPPFTAIHASAMFVKQHGLKIRIGGQTMHEAVQGAFTGEVSGAMLKEAGASFCILGHSERRHLFHETDAAIHAKIARAFETEITPLLCIGEKEHEREQGDYMNLLEMQLASALADRKTNDLKNLVVAYEPVWAIGTGKTATSDIAQETHWQIRDFIAKRWGRELAQSLRILYGGSVKPDNIGELLDQPDIDGALIGGAALDAKTFVSILNNVAKA